jgi:hypothetical protein
MRSTRQRSTTLFGLLAASVLLLAACSKNDQQAASQPAGPVTLTINVFGDNFSLPKDRSLYDEYQQAHPGVTIVENRADFGTHHQNLQARLTAGSGTADLEVIEVGQIAGFIGQPDKFVNFLDQGVETGQWTQATIARASTSDGKALIGLPTDIGGLAMCYRTDLFAAAGLPTNRDEVSALWPDWQSYLDTGSKFIAKAPKNVKWFDAGGHVFTGILGNDKETYYGADGKLIVDSNPQVRAAWDQSVKAIKGGESAALAEFSPRVEHRFPAGPVRHRHLPGLDDGLHQVERRADRRKVGHRKDSRWLRQLGWFLRHGSDAGQEPEGRDRAGQVADRAGAERQAVQADRQLPQPEGHLDPVRGGRLQLALLQQRAGRQDLPGVAGQRAGAGDRAAERGHRQHLRRRAEQRRAGH